MAKKMCKHGDQTHKPIDMRPMPYHYTSKCSSPKISPKI